MIHTRVVGLLGVLAALLLMPGLRAADQVQMTNGDRYFGQVVSMDTNVVVLQSDTLGRVRLDRARVAAIVLVPAPAPAASGPSNAVPTNQPAGTAVRTQADLEAALRDSSAVTNMIPLIQAQLLSAGGPVAGRKFDELMQGLLSGQLNLGDIRTQAQSAARQIRDLKQDLGEDAGSGLDGYLQVLENFLQQTEPEAPRPASIPPPAPSP